MVQLQRIAIAPTQISNRHINLTAEQQHYLGRVLRLQVGDRFIAIDGRGHWWRAELEVSLPAPSPQAIILEAMVVQTELPVEVRLGVSLPKTGFDDIVRYSTELGVSQIVPIISQRTVLKPSPQKLERWRRIAREAAEQSERQIIPSIVDPISLATVMEDSHLFSLSTTHQYICVARGSLPHLLNCMKSSPLDSVTLLTGPEGGWTTAEVEMAIAAGFLAVSLGKRILRAVTAPIVALSYVTAVLESSPIPEDHLSV
ncbi:16S rRNA (uracil(1498)-N(3))-methyltransferase [Limnoraphis robusta Tam1]|uniref:Ribosomal RNA small subunit methyltransferase E n=1 Tax=Limnoraphis robusta CCNP1315 TaxID=3110306 RepID=A0ABU5TSC7_9CYAN|nr:16S rRNA (uracil(1498)-N(3))-methyltransferase [Limnoraphis robusta]MEA5499651.1 16S rRNA (uracil(1498)-N(3))-methyltransferase [Limnoraphis robusta BA-68 BA1]MEA5517801.1 16S rRNA (uracil(1498)-N(3))-methyltransferase [Limnoraphis robusta CCNP1315]MEA5541042.1 16S rRNA (uracil(1498)-N(3))-methyltransferase [Limnoraphis robusta Tam1]MEA5546393.1 16S rRNA (uracil(1498)-N(3))-methyltransferase [Limnoraphis robusta CCNP1324]